MNRYLYEVTGNIPGVGGFAVWVPAVSESNAFARVQDVIPDADMDLAELQSETPMDDLG